MTTKIFRPLASALEAEREFRSTGINLLANEGAASSAVTEILGNQELASRAIEGGIGRRYTPGLQHLDEHEAAAIQLARTVFRAEHADLRPLSGTIAAQAVFDALLNPGDRILALDLAHGGHFSGGMGWHRSGKTYAVSSYGVTNDIAAGIDMAHVERQAQRCRPKVIHVAPVTHPRTIDYSVFGYVAKKYGATLVVDLSHFAGFVATGLHPSPFPHADVLTLSTRKTLCGPFGGLILWNDDGLSNNILRSVYPGNQGSCPASTFAAKAQCLYEADSADRKNLMQRCRHNTNALGSALQALGYRLTTGGGDGHMLVVDISHRKIGGAKAEKVLATVGILVDKRRVPFDSRSPNDPSGLRMGTLGVTNLGLEPEDMGLVAKLIDRTLVADEGSDEHTKVAEFIRKEFWNKS